MSEDAWPVAFVGDAALFSGWGGNFVTGDLQPDRKGDDAGSICMPPVEKLTGCELLSLVLLLLLLFSDW